MRPGRITIVFINKTVSRVGRVAGTGTGAASERQIYSEDRESMRMLMDQPEIFAFIAQKLPPSSPVVYMF